MKKTANRPTLKPLSTSGASSSHRGQVSHRSGQPSGRGEASKKAAKLPSRRAGLLTTTDERPPASDAALIAEVTELRAEKALNAAELNKLRDHSANPPDTRHTMELGVRTVETGAATESVSGTCTAQQPVAASAAASTSMPHPANDALLAELEALLGSKEQLAAELCELRNRFADRLQTQPPANVNTSSSAAVIAAAAVEAPEKARAPSAAPLAPATSQPEAFNDALADASAVESTECTASNSWTLVSWLVSLDLASTVAAALVPPDGTDAFTYTTAELSEHLDERLAAANLQGLANAVRAGLDTLRVQKAATGAELSGKFKEDAFKGEMSFATLDTFYAGLSGLIGDPLMVDGSLMRGMQDEHRKRPDSEVRFLRSMSKPDKPKYATPAEEWTIVHEPEEGKQYSSGRIGMPLAVFEALMRDKNALLAKKGHTELILEEVVGARLYTGCVMHHTPRAASLAHSVPFC